VLSRRPSLSLRRSSRWTRARRKAFDSVAAMVNEHHSVLSIHEREWLAGALVALRNVGVPVDQDALRGHLMSAGWGGRLIDQAISLAERVARGETPRHRPDVLEADFHVDVLEQARRAGITFIYWCRFSNVFGERFETRNSLDPACRQPFGGSQRPTCRGRSGAGAGRLMAHLVSAPTVLDAPKLHGARVRLGSRDFANPVMRSMRPRRRDRETRGR
jgi:hypothetical protein